LIFPAIAFFAAIPFSPHADFFPAFEATAATAFFNSAALMLCLL
jgi:hypothetical protein